MLLLCGDWGSIGKLQHTLYPSMFTDHVVTVRRMGINIATTNTPCTPACLLTMLLLCGEWGSIGQLQHTLYPNMFTDHIITVRRMGINRATTAHPVPQHVYWPRHHWWGEWGSIGQLQHTLYPSMFTDHIITVRRMGINRATTAHPVPQHVYWPRHHREENADQ